MYQNELQTEMDKILKALAYKPAQLNASPKLTYQSDTSDVPIGSLAANHCSDTPTPSDALADLKV